MDLTNTWSKTELVPYQTLVSENISPMIMTAHIFNKNLDPSVPATLSRPIITGLLKEKIGFTGVVISDDLQMGAIKNHYTLEEVVVKLINAGVDILLIGNNLDYDPEIDEKIHKIIKEKIADGEISEEQIHESYQKIITLKKQFNIMKQEQK